MRFVLEIELGTVETIQDVMGALSRSSQTVDETRPLRKDDGRKMRDRRGNEIGSWRVIESTCEPSIPA